VRESRQPVRLRESRPAVEHEDADKQADDEEPTDQKTEETRPHSHCLRLGLLPQIIVGQGP
jgi:hypothetical protein